MEPFTIFTTALSGIKTATDIAIKLQELNKATDNVELKEQLISLREALVESKSQILDVKEILQEKDAKIKGLEERLERDEKLSFNEALGCLETDENGKIIKYCSNCHAEGKYIQLKAEGKRFICVVCDKKYQNGSGVSISVCPVKRC